MSSDLFSLNWTFICSMSLTLLIFFSLFLLKKGIFSDIAILITSIFWGVSSVWKGGKIFNKFNLVLMSLFVCVVIMALCGFIIIFLEADWYIFKSIVFPSGWKDWLKK